MDYYLGTPASDDRMWLTEAASVAGYCTGRGLDPGAGARTLYESTVRLDCFRERRPHVQGHAATLPFRDGVFDYVFTCHLLEHLADPVAALREWLRVVRPGGHVASVIPDTRFTHGQNTDPTPHRFEWGPRDFINEVLWPGERRAAMWFIETGWSERIGAEVVQFAEGCRGWSFSLVLRKGGDHAN